MTYVYNKLVLNKNEILILNPCKNIYSSTEPFFELAERFLNKPLAYYISTIINASKIILTDSSFFSLSLNLPIKTKECYIKSRDNRNYDYLYKLNYWKDL